MTINPLNELEAIAQTLASLSASMEKDLGDLPYSRICGYITQTNNLADDIFHEISVLREKQGEEQVRAYVSGNADGYLLAKQTIEAEQSELFEAEKETAREQLEREPEIPEGFTKWDGAHTPLGPGSFLQVMYRDGEVSGPCPSDEVFAYWEGDGCDDDVIAYRIVDAPSQSDPNEQDDASDFVSDLQGDSVPQMQQAFDEILAAQERPALNADMQDEREQLVDGYAPVINPEADFWARGLTEQPKPEPFRLASIFRRAKEDA